MAAHEFDGERYRAAACHQREWGDKLISELELRGDEKVLDLGCCDGTVTASLATLVPHGSVLGLDASAGMIAAARPLEQKNLRFALQDIRTLDFEDEFDLIFSNSALHWLKDQPRLLAACHRALKKGGRLRAGFPGTGSAAGFIQAVKQVMGEPAYRRYFAGFEWPWYMPEASEYEALVRESGFREVSVQGQTLDRSFSAAQLIGFLDQPALVPFLARVAEVDKEQFREEVVQATLELTARGQDEYFEPFRRLIVSACK
jgi:trans-aconitate 2-methyltransferase